jgi:ribose transport system substrate-binding protein
MSHSQRAGWVAKAAVVVAATALALTGCSSAASTASNSTAKAKLSYIGPSATSAQAAAVIKSAGKSTSTAWCGKKPITVGVEDGVGVNGWSASSYAAVRSELAKCSNVKVLVSAGGGDLAKAIANTNADVAQGVNAIVMIPDFGSAQLPSIKAATAAGVKVVPWAAGPGGTPGKDYVSYVDWSTPQAGVAWTDWVAKNLPNATGNVVYLGGPAGNPVSVGTLQGIASESKKFSGLNILTGLTTFPATNWDPAVAQQIMASLIAKYPKIDAVITDDSSSSVGALNAFSASGRPFPIIGTEESNLLACTYQKAKSSHPELQLAIVSGRNWLGRVAARKAVAAAEGLPENDPSTYNLPIYEDSTSDAPPKCDSSVSPSTFFSDQISASDLSKYGNANS